MLKDFSYTDELPINDERHDIFSLGAICYILLTGENER